MPQQERRGREEQERREEGKKGRREGGESARLQARSDLGWPQTVKIHQNSPHFKVLGLDTDKGSL